MAGRLRTIDARTLADAVLEPPGYAVKDLLVQGLHILAGAPKTGKSWLALWLCQQVAGGEKVWGYPTQQGTVLYLCLEDGYRRLQDRLLDITEDCALPGFVDSKNEEKTERNAGYLVVSHSGGGMLRQGTRKGIRRTPANRGMRAHWVVKGLDISEDVCHGMCP